MFWSMHSGIVAAIATVFARYAGYFVPMGDWGLRATAVAAIVLLSIINYLGAKLGSRVQAAFTFVKVGAVVLIILAGFLLPHDAAAGASAATAARDWGANGLLLAVGAGLFAFGGWHMVTYTAEETVDPQRTIPRSLMIGIAVVTLCYIGLNAVYLTVLPIDGIIKSTRVAADTFDVLIGSGGGGLISALVLLSSFGALNGIVLVGPRVYYQMAQDGLWFKWAADVHPTYQTPAKAIALQAVWASALALTGTYRALFSRVIYTEWIFFALLALGVLLARRRAGYRPAWRMPLAPFLTSVFVLASAAIVVNQMRADWQGSAWGLGMVLSGLPVYYFWSRRGR
jgi:APA family basic amino acid/polyamine antiporter